jgi:NADH:ubiquinone oxidoreductase subunit F (NADH-binding)/Pyruvate/2-oxoacid:ferredoxin oxidoreductase delta subunit
LFEGAGAFVCGEESALIASLEGRRGMPGYRPPFPAEKGFNGCPTLVNNAETYSTVPWIVRNGADAFAGLGTEYSKGSKVFSLAGKVARGGVIAVPMGITIREVVEEIGGGVAEGRAFKAVQVGGPSGGCIPAAMGHTPVDFEALAGVGAMMGSGGFVVLDDTDCMVEMARYFLSFTQSESCGKCTPCRVGTKRMLEILERLCKGGGKAGDIEKLEQLAKTVKAQSLCGLGKTAPNPVLTTINYFRAEFEAHIEGRCPAGKCEKLITFSITDDCIGCTKCAVGCPVEAISGEPYTVYKIDPETCVRCGACREICPVDAVQVV